MARARQPAPVAPTGFVASAVRLPTSSRNMAGRSESWQAQAWNYWEAVGELRFLSTWIGNVLSRARLVPAKREGRMLIPITDPAHPASEAMDALYGGVQGQSEMLQLYGIHQTVAGEEYIVNRAKGDQWNTLAAGKVTQLPGGGNGRARLRADFGLEGGSQDLAPDDLVIRVWTPHPGNPARPDSPTRANLSTLAQIVGYDQHIAAQIQSRLAGAGILFLSNEAEFPVPEGADPAASPASHFMSLLGEAMMTPIADRSNPSALVPIVAMVPTDSLGKNEHLKFWSELDDAVIEMRDAAIKRFALGMDTPPEVLLGVADANHWNAWLSEESAVKAHIEPRLSVFSFALTEQYLQPSLKGVIPDDVEDYFVIADTSGIRLRPNRSQEAIELYNLGELSGPALRRETGFQPEDAPADEQIREWLLRKIATGSTTPDQTQAAFRLLGIDLGPTAGDSPQRPPDNLRTDTRPELTEHTPPDMEEGRRVAMRDQTLAAACDVLVYKALERVGNKLITKHPRTDATRSDTAAIYRTLSGDIDTLLAGAWTGAADVLVPYTDDVEGTIGTLDFYVRGLLSTKRAHNARVLGALLACQPASAPLAIGA